MSLRSLDLKWEATCAFKSEHLPLLLLIYQWGTLGEETDLGTQSSHSGSRTHYPSSGCLQGTLEKVTEKGRNILKGGRHKKLYTPAAITFFQQHSQTRKPFASSRNTTDVRRKVPLKISLRAPIIITSYVQSSLAAVGCYTFMVCPSKLSRVKRDAKGNRNSNSVHCPAACQLPKCCKASLTHL